MQAVTRPSLAFQCGRLATISPTASDSPTQLLYSAVVTPSFLIGCHRSGTTLLRYLLDTHSRIACPPETKLLTALAKTVSYPQTVPALRTIGVTEKDLLVELGTVFSRMMEAYTVSRKKQLWVDKTPNHYTIIDQIDRMFHNQARYIFLVRNPFDTIVSLEKFFLNLSDNHEDPEIRNVAIRYGNGRMAWAQYWKEVNERILLSVARYGSRTLLIKYEDLVNSTPKIIDQVFDFLSVNREPKVIESALKSIHDLGYQDRSILKTSAVHSNSLFTGWSKMNKTERTIIWNSVSNVASWIGYTEDADLCSWSQSDR